MTFRDYLTPLVCGLWACGLLISCGGEYLEDQESFAAGKADTTVDPIFDISPVYTQPLSEVGNLDGEDCTLVRIRPGHSGLTWLNDRRQAWSPALINKSEVLVQDGYFYSQAEQDRKVRYKLEDSAEELGSQLKLMSTDNASYPGQVKMNVAGHLLSNENMVGGRALILNWTTPKYMGDTSNTNIRSDVFTMDAMVIYLKNNTLQPDPEIKSVLSCARLESLADLPWKKGGCYWFKAPEGTPYCFEEITDLNTAAHRRVSEVHWPESVPLRLPRLLVHQ